MNKKKYRGMVVTDFDGTIYTSGKKIHPNDLDTLRKLEKNGFVRVIATGRSMQSLYRALDSSFPVDYVVFSSGAGVLDLKKEKLLCRRVFSSGETVDICRRLMSLKADFMVHHPIPDNHFFHYHHEGGENPDFFERLKLYQDYASPFDPGEIENLEATQFVIIEPPEQKLHSLINDEFHDVSVIWSSSPLDHRSRWIEIFPKGANKGSGIAWLADLLAVDPEKVMVVGNDFNDLHMLEWASHGYVVKNAPEALRKLFPGVAACDEAGFTEAFEKWYAALFSGTPGTG